MPHALERRSNLRESVGSRESSVRRFSPCLASGLPSIGGVGEGFLDPDRG